MFFAQLDKIQSNEINENPAGFACGVFCLVLIQRLGRGPKLKQNWPKG